MAENKERITKFVDVLLPLAIPNSYTYRVPYELNDQIRKGIRVVVQFGKRKLYSGIVKSVHEIAPSNYSAKYIEHILDEFPVVNDYQLKLWEWMADYYLCHQGEIMNAALPIGMKLISETKLVVHPDFTKEQLDSMNDQEYLIMEALETNGILSLDEVGEIIDRKTVYPLVKSLLEQKAVISEEELKTRYTPKMVSFVKLSEKFQDEAELEEAFKQLEKAPKQLQLLMAYLQLSRADETRMDRVKKIQLQKKADATATLVNQLVKKGIFELYEVQEDRLNNHTAKTELTYELNAYQEKALEEVNAIFESKDVALLHGVTSSGKTEIYIQLIKKAIDQGKHVLYLLPEIALTTQLVNRLRRFFGDKVGVYHSKFNQNERVEIWQNVIQENRYQIILGARSAVLLPFTNLGLIIVDEEHESTFKQYTPSPRYHARDIAIVLAGLHHAKVLLGSATPSVESYSNATNGKYGLVELTKRHGGVQMPEILVADIKEASRKKQMKSHFSPFLLEYMENVLENKEQVILFQNRRGFAPFLQCDTCAHTPQCKRCDVNLTYHKGINELKCHYCGFRTKPPINCEACGDTNVKMRGFGTEKIEEELAIFFPNARIARMDLDTTRSKHAYAKIIADFEDRNVDVLIGTQMVTKGLDFDNVALVGILNADNLIHYPDFRAHERSYQLMAQVAGRAGRKNKRGKVIIQTYTPDHAIIRYVIANDYAALYRTQALERRNFHFPPFSRLIKLTFKHKEIDKVNGGAQWFADQLRKYFGNHLLGPEFPTIARIRNLYQKELIIKVIKGRSVVEGKQRITTVLNNFKQENSYKSVRVDIDVDPY